MSKGCQRWHIVEVDIELWVKILVGAVKILFQLNSMKNLNKTMKMKGLTVWDRSIDPWCQVAALRLS